VIKRIQKESDKATNKILAEIYQNRTADKGRIFRGFSFAEIKKCSTNESLDITWGICTRNRRSKIFTENFHEFLRCSTENCFRTATSPNLTTLKLEASLGTKTK
jgi:ribosomal protein L13E